MTVVRLTAVAARRSDLLDTQTQTHTHVHYEAPLIDNVIMVTNLLLRSPCIRNYGD